MCLKSSDVCKFSVFVCSAWGASNCWTGIWTGMMEWNDGMEHGMEWWIYTVAANLYNWCCAIYIRVELPSVSLRVLTHHRGFMNKLALLTCFYIQVHASMV